MKMKVGDLVKYGIYLGLVVEVASCTTAGWSPGSVLVRWHGPGHHGAADSWFSTSVLEIVNESR